MFRENEIFVAICAAITFALVMDIMRTVYEVAFLDGREFQLKNDKSFCEMLAHEMGREPKLGLVKDADRS